MPQVTMPDGSVVEMPENISPELGARLRAYISAQHGDIGEKFAEGKAHEEIPDSGNIQPEAPKDESVAAGVPGAILAMASGIPAQLAGNVAGAVDRATGASMEDAAKKAQEVSGKLTYNPSEAGKTALGKVADILDKTKLAGVNPDLALTGAALRNAPIRDVASRAVRALKDSPEATIVKSAAGAPRAAAHALVIPEVRALAQKASDFGIDIRPDMLTDNKFMRMMGEALEKVPASGSRADQRQIAFNRAIMQQIGVDTRAPVKRLTPDVFDKAMNESGAKIGEISKKTPINLAADDPAGFDQQLSSFVANAEKMETSDHARIASNLVKELRDKAEDGVIPGETFRRINTQIGNRLRTTKDGDLKRVLSDLQDLMQDALERHVAILHPEEIPVLKLARKQYAIGKTIEPLVAKSRRGDVSPAGLMGAMTSDSAKKSLMARGRSGEMGDLARIGQAFLKEPDSSGTTERAVAYGLLGGGAAVEPHTAAGIYALANLYNRSGPLIARKMVK